MAERPENSALPIPATSGASATVNDLKGSGPKRAAKTRTASADTSSTRRAVRSCSGA
jgi:hypothetical protein